MHELANGLEKLFHFGPVILFIVALAVADYLTTRKILASGGVELNPVLKWLIDRNLFTPAKGFLTLFVIALIWHYGTRYKLAMDIASVIIIAGYLYVVIHNILQIRKTRR